LVIGGMLVWCSSPVATKNYERCQCRETARWILKNAACNLHLLFLFERCALADAGVALSPCTHDLGQDPKLFHQDELCRWLLKTDLRLAACFSMDMHDKGAFKETSTPPVPGPAYSANSGGRGGGELSTSIPPHLVYDDAVAVAVAEERIAREVCGFGYKRLENTPEPPPPGERSLKLAAAVLPDFRMLMKGTER